MDCVEEPADERAKSDQKGHRPRKSMEELGQRPRGVVEFESPPHAASVRQQLLQADGAFQRPRDAVSPPLTFENRRMPNGMSVALTGAMRCGRE